MRFSQPGTAADKRVEFQALYRQLVDDETRNRAICEEIVPALRDGENELSARVPNVVVLRGGAVGQVFVEFDLHRLIGISIRGMSSLECATATVAAADCTKLLSVQRLATVIMLCATRSHTSVCASGRCAIRLVSTAAQPLGFP
jgi:hypothetical protein